MLQDNLRAMIEDLKEANAEQARQINSLTMSVGQLMSRIPRKHMFQGYIVIKIYVL